MAENELLHERLIRLETTHKERWDSHDLRANEMREDIRDGFQKVGEKFDRVFSKLEDLPCKGHEERIKNNENHKAVSMRLIVGSILAVIGGLAAVLGRLVAMPWGIP